MMSRIIMGRFHTHHVNHNFELHVEIFIVYVEMGLTNY